MTRWQPIETAPKDGCKVDLWTVRLDGFDGGGRVVDCWWNAEKAAWYYYHDRDYGDCRVEDAGHTAATHWRSAQDAPESAP